MLENGVKLDPLNPEDWKKVFDESQKDFDAFFESKEQASPEAGFESEQEKTGFSPEQEMQLKKLEREIDAILNRDEFERYKNEGENKKRLDGYKSDILKQAKGDIENVDKFDAEGELMKRAQGAETIKDILAMMMIKDAASFDELFAKLDKLGSIKGSHTTYDAEALKNIINEVRKGKLDINSVTNTWGLRERVNILLDKEKKENNVNRKKIKNLYRRLSKIYHPDNKKSGNEEKFKEINEANENDDLERLLAIETEYEQDKLANSKKNENKKFDLNSLNENENRELDELKNGCEKLYRDLRKDGKFKDYDEAKLFIVQYLKNNIDIANELKNRPADEKNQLVDILLKDFELKLTQINEEIESLNSALTLEEISDKLKNAGADDEDIKYFFNLKKEDRNDFLNSSEEDLRIRIEKLKEIRLANNARDILLTEDETEKRFLTAGATQEDIEYFYSLDKESRLSIINLAEDGFKLRIESLKKDRIIIPLTSELEKTRQDYLRKENEIGLTVSRLKNFFKNIIVDDKYEIEKELEEYKEKYELALKNYTQAIVDVEGLDDKEEREILYRYAKFGETLNLMNAKEDIKFQRHPDWEGFKRDLGIGSLSLIDKYKDLLGKSKDFIAKKTGSKILGIGGGAIAVGGAMSLLAGVVPGVRGIARAMGIAVATKGFYENAEMKTVANKEKDIEKSLVDIERRYAYLNTAADFVNDDFKREIELLVKNIPESAQKERDAEKKRIITSFGKAILVNLAFYEAGKALKDSGLIEEGVAMIKEYIPIEKLAAMMGLSHNSGGGAVHSGPNYPPVVENKSPVEQINVETVKEDEVINAPKINQDSTIEMEKNSDKIGVVKESTPGDNISAQEIEIDSAGKEVAKDEFEGIEVNDLSRGNVVVIEGKGIKDSVASLLAQNSERLTEGKMGWDPNKYKSVEEWANKRAVGIVAELKEKYPKYNFDKVSVDSKIEVDLSNKADIKIVGFDDPKHLGGDKNLIKNLAGGFSKEEVAGIEKISQEKNIPEIKRETLQVNIERDIEGIEVEINRANTLKEISVAHSLGFKPGEYAELNDISLKQLLGELKDSGNPENPNVKLKNLFNFMIENGQIDDMDKTISETIRGLSDQTLKDMTVGYKAVTPEEYNVFINGLMRGEFQLGMSLNGMRGVFLNLDKIRDNSIGNQSNGEIFKLFKESVEKSGIKFGYNDSDSVKSYVMKAMIRAYENGSIGKLREALREMNRSIK